MTNPAQQGISATRRAWKWVAITVAILTFGSCSYFALQPAKWTLTDNGTYQVCIWTCDAKPGVWTSTVPAGDYCIWIRQGGERWSKSSEISRGKVAPGGSARVELRDGEYFVTLGCGTWTLQNGG